jgi:hypothetical protein
MAWSNNIFYIAFLSQIFLLSYYFPNKLLARMRHVLASYPPAEYPRLYPKPVEHYKLAHLAFKYVCRFILLLGLFVLFAVVFLVDHGSFADDGFISEAWPAAYGVIQFLPLMAMEFSEYSHFKQMRKANSASKRSAELRRRSVTDLVSPGLLGTTVALFAAAILFDLYVHDFAVSWGHDTIQRALVMSVTNGLLLVVGAWNLYGRKLDPHQTAHDRSRRTAVTLKSLLYISMALSVFIAMTAADDMYDLDFIDALLMSVYFQAITLLSLGYTLRNIKLEQIDFDVYKNGEAAAQAH